MNDFYKRVDALSPKQLKLLKEKLKGEGIDIDLETGIKETADKKNIYASLKPVEEKEYYPLSSVQKRLFTINRLEGAGTVYNVTWIRVIEGDLDLKGLEKVFKTLVKRHESFRTSFEYIDGKPVQHVHKPGDVEFKVRYFDPGNKGNKEHHATVVENFIKPFVLNKPPLLRVGVIKLSEGGHILIYDMHHIISDLTSKKILMNEFIRLYAGEGEGLDELKVQYKDFSEWQNSEKVKAVVKQQENYWLKQFAGEIPPLNLPADYARPVNKSFEGASISFKIEQKETAILKSLALKENTTLFVIVLSIYNVFLAKIARQTDIIVGTPIVGRRHADLDHVIGMFVNTLALRNDVQGHWTFVEFLNRVKQRMLDAFENQDYPFEDLVNQVIKTRDTSRNPIFDAFFSFTYPNVKGGQEQQEQEQPVNLHVKPYAAETTLSMFDLFLYGLRVREELLLGFTYSTRLFKEETIKRFTGYFKEILFSIVENNQVKLKDIKISHHLGIAKSKISLEDESDFGF